MIILFLLLFICVLNSAQAYLELNLPDHKYALDLERFERVLDPELCEEQVKYLVQNDTNLLVEFLDAGIRTPRGVLTGNLLDLGNYYQCLGINQETPSSNIEGKYCMISLPLDQNVEWPSFPEWPDWPDWSEIPWPEFPWPDLNPNTTRIKPGVLKRLKEFNAIKAAVQTLTGSRRSERLAETSLSSLTFNLAVCIPKVCSTQMVLDSLFGPEIGIEYNDNFCRLPNDKPFVPGDYVALAVFSLIALLTILSTAYDIRYQKYLHGDPKNINKLYQSFSIYTNTRRLVTYTPVPGALECLDGIRAFAMMWVILGHTYSSQLSNGIMANPLDTFSWIMSLSAIWITSGPITVDTFFMLSGLLLVYTTAGKFTGSKLLKNLHLFYLNRLLRMFPILAAVMLMQVSIFNWVVDGPHWVDVMHQVHPCRVYWWSTLLHVQNFVNPSAMCIPHSWYVAIDVQLYIVSPVVLFWVLSDSRKVAWTALIGAFVAVTAAATAYNFVKAFPSGPVIPSRPDEATYYMYEYYVHTLCRASPFFVGMIVGYFLHEYRKQKAVLPAYLVVFLWICATVIMALVLYSSYPIMQLDWDNQFADDMINSFMRPGWAMAVGWLIFACVHGYAGIINWILSLRTWKILGRLSYAMYLVHYPLIFMVNAMPVAPVFFSVEISLFKFLAHFSLAALVAFLLTVIIDAPFSTLVKLSMGGGPRREPEKGADVADKDQSSLDTKPRRNSATVENQYDSNYEAKTNL